MPVTLTPINNITTLIKATGESFVYVFSANFNTLVVTSPILPARMVEILQERLRVIMNSLPDQDPAVTEPAFAGVVRSLFSGRQYEPGAPLADPSHLLFAIGMSTSSRMNDYAEGQEGGGTGIFEVFYNPPVPTVLPSIADDPPLILTQPQPDSIVEGQVATFTVEAA